MNCHPGLLPKYRGCTSVEWAIYNDDQVGNTVHLMTEGIDEGPVLIKEGLSFTKNENYYDIRIKVFNAGARLMAEAVFGLQTGKITIDDFETQSNGNYYNVIEDNKMTCIHRKLNNGKYKYQK